MRTINSNTKAARRFVLSYMNSNDYSLRDVYGHYSTAKACAEIECRDMMRKENGRGFKIMSFNTFGFTCGWMVGDVLRVETPSNSYRIA
jgi:hypothetical protein